MVLRSRVLGWGGGPPKAMVNVSVNVAPPKRCSNNYGVDATVMRLQWGARTWTDNTGRPKLVQTIVRLQENPALKIDREKTDSHRWWKTFAKRAGEPKHSMLHTLNYKKSIVTLSENHSSVVLRKPPHSGLGHALFKLVLVHGHAALC